MTRSFRGSSRSSSVWAAAWGISTSPIWCWIAWFTRLLYFCDNGRAPKIDCANGFGDVTCVARHRGLGEPASPIVVAILQRFSAVFGLHWPSLFLESAPSGKKVGMKDAWRCM
jgi:hypothetical protein